MKKKIVSAFISLIIVCILNGIVVLVGSLLFEKNTDAYKDVATLYEIAKGNNIDFPSEQMVLSNWTGDQSWRENGMSITKLPAKVLECEYVKCSKFETTLVRYLQTKYNSVLCFRYNILKENNYNQLTYSMEFIHLFDNDYVLANYNENKAKGESIKVLYKANENIYECLSPYQEEVVEFIKIPSDFWYKLNLNTYFIVVKMLIYIGLFILIYTRVNRAENQSDDNTD